MNKTKTAMHRIGLFSGTLDPMHVGHVEACLSAKAALNLDEVLVMIEKKPHRKQKVTDYKHRHKIAELSLQDFESIHLFDPKSDHITFDQTTKLLEQTYSGAKFVMIIGSDMLGHIGDWPGAKQWLDNNELAVVLRDNHDEKAVHAKLKDLKLKATVLPAVWTDASSSKVKTSIGSRGHSDEVHREALAYIKKHRLY